MSGKRGRKRQRRVHLENVLNELTRDDTGAFATEFSIDNHTSSTFDIYYTSMKYDWQKRDIYDTHCVY